MNTKDYKAISDIIKKEIMNAKKHLKDDEEKVKQNIFDYSLIAEKLADFFQKRESRLYNDIMAIEFNKQQFLKDCGVEK